MAVNKSVQVPNPDIINQEGYAACNLCQIYTGLSFAQALMGIANRRKTTTTKAIANNSHIQFSTGL